MNERTCLLIFILLMQGAFADPAHYETERMNQRPRDVAAESGLRRFMHDAPVTSISLSADKTLLATASQDGKVLIWDLATGTSMEIRHRKGFESINLTMDFDTNWKRG